MLACAHTLAKLPGRLWIHAVSRFDPELEGRRRITVLLRDPWLHAKAGLVLGYVGIFVAVYFPVIVTSYGFLDDYAILAQSLQGRMSDLIHQSTIYGRPLYALLMRYSAKRLRPVYDNGDPVAL